MVIKMAELSPEYFADMLDGITTRGVDISRLTPMCPRINDTERSYRVRHDANFMNAITAVLQRNGENRSIGRDVAMYAVAADDMDIRRSGYDFEYFVNGCEREPLGNGILSRLWSRFRGNYEDVVDSQAYLVRGNRRELIGAGPNVYRVR